MASCSSEEEELRQCVRALVACCRAAKGKGPAHDDQMAQMRKVIRLLSLSETELAAMPADERDAVLMIRASTLEKMRRAKRVSSGDPRAALGMVHSGSVAIPGRTGRGEPGGSSGLLNVAQSAPASFLRSEEVVDSSPSTSMSSMMGGMSIGVSPGEPMGPPAFYVRKLPARSSADMPSAC